MPASVWTLSKIAHTRPTSRLSGAQRRDSIRERDFRFGRVEDGRGSLGPMANAPFPTPAHQTGRADFRHPAFRPASPQGTRRDCSGQALEAQNAEFSMNDIECESAIAAPLHLVSSREKPAHTFKDVLVDATVCLAPRAVAKVVGPASQRPVQLVAYFGPWIDIARHQKIADPCLEPLHTLLGRARTQIPIPVRLKPMRAERVAEEVEAFLSGVSQRSFRLVDRQPELGHHRLRPR